MVVFLVKFFIPVELLKVLSQIKIPIKETQILLLVKLKYVMVIMIMKQRIVLLVSLLQTLMNNLGLIADTWLDKELWQSRLLT